MEKLKYPRTFHLPWSPGATSDDKVLTYAQTNAAFEGKKVVVLEKLDGENTTIYPDGTFHARSLDSRSHPSRTRIAALASSLAGTFDGVRIHGENVTARHSIHYQALGTRFYVFGLSDVSGAFLPWASVVTMCENVLDLTYAPVLYEGLWDEDLIRSLSSFTSSASPGDPQEGYVVRLQSGFERSQFDQSVAKYVRKGHVAGGSGHWMYEQMIPNGVKQ